MNNNSVKEILENKKYEIITSMLQDYYRNDNSNYLEIEFLNKNLNKQCKCNCKL